MFFPTSETTALSTFKINERKELKTTKKMHTLNLELILEILLVEQKFKSGKQGRKKKNL